MSSVPLLVSENDIKKNSRYFIVKEPGLKGKHDIPTVIFRNKSGTEQLKIVLDSKEALKSYPVNSVFVMTLTAQPQLNGEDLGEQDEDE